MHKLRNLITLHAVLLCPVGSFTQTPHTVALPVIGGPCEGCELVFVGMPKEIASSARIAPANQAGEALILEGTVRALDGSPAAGLVVYAYHTDSDGIYPAGATNHGRLRGWARTDESGHYRFATIRPGAYPSRTVAQHIHMHVIEPGRGTYYIDNVTFDDDPLLTPRLRQDSKGRGGPGITSPKMDPDGTWRIRRDIILGENIPGYSNKVP